MEKISHIVRGNSRVSSVDLKSSSAVRPGAPSYGRPVGESAASAEREGTTASRAAALHTQLAEQRRSGPEQVVEALADQFFMNRVRRPMEDQVVEAMPADPPPPLATGELEQVQTEETAPPPGYTPRGSYVDVRA